jgi:hypothetical protein
MQTLTERQQLLYAWLLIERSASIAEVEEHFGISTATAYRDTRALIAAGLALKTKQGVKLPRPGELSRQSDKCAFCGASVNDRTSFLIRMEDGSQRFACCPHCGLLALGLPGVESALASDYLYGRMINARQAAFLFESRINLCCEPSVLCFASEEEALSFQKGFGGKIHSLDEARERIAGIMKLDQSDAGV